MKLSDSDRENKDYKKETTKTIRPRRGKEFSDMNVTHAIKRQFFSNQMTFHDILAVPVESLVIFDDRSNFNYFKHLILRRHYYVSTFYVFSVLKPRYIRVIILFFSISLQFALNAFFYTDNLIETRRLYIQQQLSEFSLVIAKQLGKSIIAFIVSTVPVLALKLYSNPPFKHRKFLNEHLLTFNKVYIETGM